MAAECRILVAVGLVDGVIYQVLARIVEYFA